MRLGKLIEVLEALPQDLVVPKGFHNPHSWRGDYYELAFEPLEEPVKVGQLLEAAKSALGRTFQGWKGGDYKMGAMSRCYYAGEGDTGDGETISHGMIDGWVAIGHQDMTLASARWEARLDERRAIVA